MLGMLRDYEELGAQSGVAVQCDKPCRTLTSRDWESQLSRMKDSIVFVDKEMLSFLLVPLHRQFVGQAITMFSSQEKAYINCRIA